MRPSQAQQPDNQNAPNDIRQMVFLAAIKGNHALLPLNPSIEPINSQRIDNIAHAMWQVAFNNENMMKDVTAKVAMFSQLKLRTLARLNYLPSWWYMREMACGVMQRQGWILNDSEMKTYWNETVEWCRRVEVKLGVQGEGAAMKQEFSGQEGVGKVES